MSRKTRSTKRSRAKKISNRKSVGLFAKFDRRRRIVAGMALCALLAGVAYAHWQASSIENLTARDNSGPSKNGSPNPVKNITTLSPSELAEIPPEALHPQPPADAGYNASRGGLPPGALPPGVTLPGLPMPGGRTTAQGYGMYDGVRQQFTSKERDNETGLDYFGARYYSSTQGRFTSVDPVIDFKSNLLQPQGWNQYQYALNNPLRYVDPNGQSPQDSLELNLRRDEKALLEGRMSPEEFRSRQNARGVGAAVGAAIVVTALYGTEAATAILIWAAQNPNKVEQITLDLTQASTGSPAPGSPGLTIAAETRLSVTEVSTGVRLASQTGARLTESPFVGEEFVSAAGKTYDAMGGGKAYQNFGNGSKFFDSIVHHVNKSVDYVALDLKGASKNQIKAIEKFVGGLTKKQQEKIIYVKE